MRELTVAQRVIVAFDFKPIAQGGRVSVRDQVLRMADEIADTGVYVKLNSSLRACGYDLGDEVHSRRLRVFADLKLIDIPETLATDGALLSELKPELVTVMCTAGVRGMHQLWQALPETEVLGVTFPTSLGEQQAQQMFGCSVDEAVMRFAGMGVEAGIDGLISSPREVAALRQAFGGSVSLNTPGIRPEWATVAGDDQNPDRVMTPANAITAGANRIVVGRPIVQAQNPRDAVMRTLEEIASVL